MNEMSDGEKQKLFIARALAQEPKIIILDEPTAHLDLRHQMEVMAILRDSCREKEITIIASMHDIGIAARISDQVALIKDGSVVAWGRPEEVLHGTNVSELYGIDSAVYDRTIGTLEMKGGCGTKKAFCVSGSGTGAVLYRSLIRNRIDIATGILHENDIDCYVAKAIGIEVIDAPAFDMVSEELALRCMKLIERSDYLVDTGFPIGEINRGNLRLLKYAFETGKPVISLRKPEDFAAFDFPKHYGMVIVQNEYAVVDSILRNGKTC
jgi:iron complex transport system ATP-binding protein